jgi:Uma2 family endonuclease
MAAMTTLHVPLDGWTVDDLPEDVDLRCELVDGALLVTPPPVLLHQHVATQLLLRIAPALPTGWRAIGEAGVRFDDRNLRVPDVLVLDRRALDKDLASPRDLLLAVEVMSPSSVSTDRVAKPAQYAAAGIPHFWRLEPDPLVLVTYALAGEVYRETGRWTDEAAVDEPVHLRFRLPDLLG